MPFVYNVPFISVLMPMIGAMMTPFFRKTRRGASVINSIVLIAMFVLNIWLFLTLVSTGDSFTYMMGHFPAPWGNEIRGGTLEAMMACVFTLVMFFSISGGRRWIGENISEKKQYLYYLMNNLLICSMIALIYTNDIFTGYVFIEINTISACAIVMIRDTNETITATIKYLIMSLLGSGLVLLGITMLYSTTGHLLMENMYTTINGFMANGQYILPLTAALGLIALAMCIKSALFPFHTWLPDAHGSSTSSSSAILSGLVLKGYIIFLIKIFYRVVGIENIQNMHITDVLFILGVLGMIIGSANAMREKHLKRVIAYSSVAQIGYIFMGIGMGNEIGLMAALFHIIFHAVTKPMLFLSSSALSETANHSYDLRDLRGSGQKNVIAGIAFTVGSLAMVGIPLFAGFPSKMYFAMGGANAGGISMWLVFVGLAVSTVLNALYYLPATISIWRNPEGGRPDKPVFSRLFVKGRLGFSFAMIVFIIINVLVGVFFYQIMDFIKVGIASL